MDICSCCVKLLFLGNDFYVVCLGKAVLSWYYWSHLYLVFKSFILGLLIPHLGHSLNELIKFGGLEIAEETVLALLNFSIEPIQIGQSVHGLTVGVPGHPFLRIDVSFVLGVVQSLLLVFFHLHNWVDLNQGQCGIEQLVLLHQKMHIFDFLL